MYEVIYMKADYEPWWQFDGWEEEVIERCEFADLAAATAHFDNLRKQYTQKYPKVAAKDGKFLAFWSHDEKEYCEACEENLQMYHGLFIMNNGNVEKCF
ncbi:DUF1033 family protein [Planomicrobium sp. YIM 101495]|nr:DUF1033 family protein [Planomicrobium sp. YIM 101495]